MAVSEIDDIFAGKVAKASTGASSKAKSKVKAVDEPKLPTPPSTKNAKKKAKKRKRHEISDDTAGTNGGTLSEAERGTKGEGEGEKMKAKRPRAVETVQDLSASLQTSTVAKSAKANAKIIEERRSAKAKDDDLEMFRDSRGTGPRKRTEEGFLIYKEDELGIRDGGGDTPQCPFDCNCCF